MTKPDPKATPLFWVWDMYNYQSNNNLSLLFSCNAGHYVNQHHTELPNLPNPDNMSSPQLPIQPLTTTHWPRANTTITQSLLSGAPFAAHSTPKP
ncbi:hypothetical protein B0J17DRAFT_723270 [Rhizoctonia solani]|nr:hypothetical protein B0J17DRAFT_723270 [Rhizoctonia solani]